MGFILNNIFLCVFVQCTAAMGTWRTGSGGHKVFGWAGRGGHRALVLLGRKLQISGSSDGTRSEHWQVDQSGRTSADRGQGVREREWVLEELQVAATTEREGAALSGQGLFLLGLEATTEAGLIPRSVLAPQVPRVCPALSAFPQGDWLLRLPDIHPGEPLQG